LRVESARIAAKLATPIRVTGASVPPAEHRVDVAALDRARGLADRVRAGRARAHVAQVQPLSPWRIAM
jgi:hypothetical protein